MMEKDKFRLLLKGRACVFVDWANVYNWKDELKKEIDPKKLLGYLQTYKEIKQIRLYFGEDKTHPASAEFLKKMKKVGYVVVSKEVKFLKVFNENGSEFIWKRKCDMDLELGLDAYEMLDKFKSYIFFSGDGDLKTLYERLIRKKKQVIVIYMYKHLGREIWEMKKGIFKASIVKLEADFYKKMTPNRRSGA